MQAQNASLELGEVSATSPEELAEIRRLAAEEEERLAAEERAAEEAEVRNRTAQQNAAIVMPESTGPVAFSGSSSQIVNIAVSALGTRYVLGGNSPATGMDCSGFTSWVYSHIGVSLPRFSTSQSSMGTVVNPGDVQAGDLLVWNGHTGIYIGNDTIIHSATSTTGVKYSPYSGMVKALGQPAVRRF